MLYEIKDVRQIKNEGKRRWFTDSYFDLIVWYNDSNQIEGFQLCYDKEGKERAITWKKEGQYSHNKIDQGETIFSMKRTPILVADGLFDKTYIAERFKEASLNLDREISDFVYKKLIDYQVKNPV